MGKKRILNLLKVSFYTFLALLLHASVAATASAASVRSAIVWIEGVPHLELSVEGPLPNDLKEISFPVLLFNKDGNFVWQGNGKLIPAMDKPSVASVKLEKIQDPKAAHFVEVEFHHPGIPLDYWERIHFSAETATLQNYAVRRFGRFPSEKLFASVRLNRVDNPNVKKIDLTIALRDADENVISKKVEQVAVANSFTDFASDITPDGRESVGPYLLEAGAENETLGLYANWTDRVAFSNALSPVTSFEGGDKIWYVCSAQPYYLQEWAGEVTKLFPPHLRSFSRYYSPDLYDDRPGSYPVVVYDTKEKRSGQQSLRMDYGPGRDAHVFSLQTLPGFPVMAHFGVKGNSTNDRLIVHWRDRTDLERPGWGRFISYTFYPVCALNFEGWKSFRVPVIGDGLQVKSYSGNTQEVDVPIHLLAFTVHPEGSGQARSVWLDDIFVETQAQPREQLSLELRTDTADHQLHESARLIVCAGNGAGKTLGKGKLQVAARDRRGQVILEVDEPAQAASGEFLVKEFSLAETYRKNPLGPVDIDVTFMDTTTPGLKRTARVTCKKADSYGLFWDFEGSARYNGSGGGTGAKPVLGGAEESRQALFLSVEAKAQETKPSEKKTEFESVNGVLLHPALPGLVDRIEMMVKGGEKPVELEALLQDAGRNGVSNKNQNDFWLPRVRVDWQDWRKIEFPAPPVPEYYGDTRFWFFRKPWYPLNLALRVILKGEGASGVFIDNIRVRTHLLPEEELMAEVAFPDDTRLHAPGTPLDLALTNFAAKPKPLTLRYQLKSYQDRVQAEGNVETTLGAGSRAAVRLVSSLQPGIYTLALDGLEGRSIQETLEVLDAARYFGDDPSALLSDMPKLRKTLDMTVETVYLDWDNTEPVPGLFHFNWFEIICQQASAKGNYQLRPVVGFSADWAGPESQEALAKATYFRYMANHLQVPTRLSDWSAFVRQCVRTHSGRFSHWIFWENPDLKDAPQSIPPHKYPEMLKIFKHWVLLYDPQARVVAGGFNMDKTLDYLEQIEQPDKLEFDEFAVRMNMGELPPEEADIEGFLDELNQLLKMEQTGRKIHISELDWGIGDWVSPLQHAAYHARASLILSSRGADLHRFSFINMGQSFQGYGIFYRTEYGNSENIQTFKPVHIPKPAYYALRQVKNFLAEWKFVKSVQLSDSDLQANRAFIFRNAAGELTAVVWRVQSGPARIYALPAGWNGAAAQDAFGFPVDLTGGLRCTALPTFVRLPASSSLEQLVQDLRHMRPADGKDMAILDLHLSEPDSCRRANYASTGATETVPVISKLPGGRKLNEIFVQGLSMEQFEFQMDQGNDVLLSRRWLFNGDGQKLWVKVNNGNEMHWDLSKGKVNPPGARESTFILRRCPPGKNVVSIRYEQPGNCSGYRLESVSGGEQVDLARWGILGAAQTKGELQKTKNASGGPLCILKNQYGTGLGTHAVSLVEYPLDGQFSALEVTVGVDAANEGRGSAIFEIHVDGVEKANSGLMNGFSKPATLKVDQLESARRMILVVKDAGDGNQDDLADWVAGKLILK